MEELIKPVAKTYEVDLKPFPLHALPINLRQFVEAVAANVQVSPDMVAVPLLATLCIPLQSRFIVRVDAGYSEPLCLYTLTVARPSERKSAIISILEKPLWEWQKYENEKEFPVDRPPVTLYVTDATPEKLARIMEENHGSAALLSDEPDTLAVAAGLRYGRSRNLGLMLQAWSAGRVMIQRMTADKPVAISRAVMSVAVMSQPSFVEELVKDREMSQRGFMQRFLYAQPLSRVGSRSFQKPDIPLVLLKEYEDILFGFLDMDTDRLRELRLSPDGKKKAELCFEHIERQMADSPAMEGWMGKLFGQVLRIAGVFHCAMYLTEAEEHEIDWNTVQAASEVGEYFLSHAKAIFTDTDVPEDVRDARDLYRRLLDADMETFTKTNVDRLMGGHFSSERKQAALTLLVEGGYLGVIAKGETAKEQVARQGAEFNVLKLRADRELREALGDMAPKPVELN